MKYKLFTFIIIIFILQINLSFAEIYAYENAKLKWDAVSNADGYIIYYGQNKNSMTLSFDVGNITEYKILDLQYVDPDYSWYFSVSAYEGSNESNKCDPIRWSGLSKEYTLIWSKSISADVAGYMVYMRNSEVSTDNNILIYNGNNTSCNTPLLIGGGTYLFRVIAFDNAGNESSIVEIEETINGLSSVKEPDITSPEPINNLLLIQ